MSTRSTVAIPFIMSGSPDPLNIFWSGDWAVCSNTWATLVDMNWLGQPIPRLAKSWEVSADGRRWTFHLAPNRKWSDGSRMHTLDIVHSLEKSKLGTSHTQLSRMIAKIDAVEDSIVVELREPVPNLLGLLAFTDWAIFHPASFIRQGDKWRVTAAAPCSGPFCYSPQEAATTPSMVFTRNEHYSDQRISADRAAPSTVELMSYSNCSDLLKLKDRLISFRAYADDLTPECLAQLRESRFDIFPPRPAWLQKVDFSSRAIKSLTHQVRLDLLSAVAMRIRQRTLAPDSLAATGLRSTHLEGSLSEKEYLSMILELRRASSKPTLPKQLTIVTARQWSQWPSYQMIVSILRDLNIEILELTFERSEFGRLRSSGILNEMADLIFMPFGAGDPDPDTSWQFAANHLYPGIISPNRLKSAFLESDAVQRMANYRQFSVDVLKAGVFIPLTVTSDIVGVYDDFKFENSAAIRVGIDLHDYVYKNDR